MNYTFGKRPADTPAPASLTAAERATDAASLIRDRVLLSIEPTNAVRMTQPELTVRVDQLVAQIANERRLLFNQHEQRGLVREIVDDMLGLGPIEALLRDDTVSDVLVNGPHKIYVERCGRLERTGLTFRNDAHVLHVAQRVASSVGRRVDEFSPMLDARLADGSRVNVIIPPLAIQGPCISIRRFSRVALDIAALIQRGTLSPKLGRVLEIATRCRLNIVITGGTGSGKTTLLNALSR